MRQHRARAGISATLAMAVAGILLAGCSLFGGEEEAPAKTPRATLGYPRSWIWSGATGVALESPDATAVRAWVESAALYQDTRVAYPGFAEATAQRIMDGLSGADQTAKAGGTDRILIRSLTVTKDELRASLCVDGWDRFYFIGTTGDFFGAGPDLSTAGFVMRRGAGAESVIRAHSSPDANQPSAALDPSQNPGQVVPHTTWLKGPTTDVFAGWVTTSRDRAVEPPADCVAWFKRNHPGLKYPTGYTAEERPNRPVTPPPPTLPASPGW